MILSLPNYLEQAWQHPSLSVFQFCKACSLLWPVLSPRDMHSLAAHKYRVQNNSILDPWMQPFWQWVLESLVPKWVAPNALTFAGLVVNVMAATPLLLFCPTAKERPPRWTLLLAALGLFAYQTLDAIDGKQARRTGTVSPMGELFDHGCDRHHRDFP